MAKEDKHRVNEQGKSFRKRLIAFSKGLFTALLLFIFLISILSKNSAVQSWYTARFSSYLSSKTGYGVSIGKTHANLFKGIEIEEIEIIDLHQNSLMSAKSIHTSLRKNLFSLLFDNSINLEELKINGAKLNIIQYADEDKNNLIQFIEKLSGKSASTASCRTTNIKKLYFNELVFTSKSARKKTAFEFSVKSAKIYFDHLDLCHNFIGINELFLSEPSVHYLVDPKRLHSQNGVGDVISQKNTDTLHFLVRHFVVDEGKLKFSKTVSTKNYTFPNSINFDRLELEKINLEAREVEFSSVLESHFKVEQMSFIEKSGFELDRLSIEHGHINNKSLKLDSVFIETANSTLRNHIALKYNGYRSFLDFNNKVYINASFHNSNIQTADIMFFAPALNKNEFFRENKNKTILINGQIKGRVNSLKGTNIKLKLEKDTYLTGSFSSKNLTVPGEQLMNIRLVDLSSNTKTFIKLFPSFELSPEFQKFGNFNFQGSFDGYFHDFVAYGQMQTGLGRMNMDMRLDLSRGEENADYSGNFKLISFDLGKLTGRQDLGNITLSAHVIDGHGLNINTVRAELNARVDSIQFKDHQYKNLVMKGYLDKNLFNGDFSIDEKYVNFDLSGIINYGDSIPKFKFTAAIQKMDLANMKVSKSPLIISSTLYIDLQGSNFDNISGEMLVKKLMLSNKKENITLDSIYFTSILNDNGERYVDLSSEVLSFSFDGKYSLNQIPHELLEIFKRNFPAYTDQFTKHDEDKAISTFYYDFYVYVPDSKKLIGIIQPTPVFIRELVMSGHINHSKDQMDINSSVEEFEIAEIKVSHLHADIQLDKSNGTLKIDGEKINYKNLETDSLIFDARLSSNLISYNLRVDTIDKNLNSIGLSGITIPHPKGLEIQIENGNIELLDENWYFKNDNKLILGKNYIAIENFGLFNKLNAITFDDINENKGVKAVISGFEIALLNPVLRFDRLQFSGKAEGFLRMPEIFRNRLMEGAIRLKELYINKEPYGYFNSLVQLDKNARDKINFSGSLDNGIHKVEFKGNYNFKDKFIESEYKIRKFPLAILEQIIVDGISETKGYVNGNLSISGPIHEVEITGKARAYDGQTKVNYLGTRYFFDDQKVDISTNYMDFTGVKLYDVKGNEGRVIGGIKYRRFKDWELDLTLQSPKIIALSTTKKQNPLYYGQGIGSVNARFSGPFKRADITIDATALQGSSLTIPVRYETEVSEHSFIKFKNPGGAQTKSVNKPTFEMMGLSMDMNLTIEHGAEIDIILDENAGDHIKGKGTGNIRLEISRNSDIEMYGNYTIDEGTYLFTALTLIQKPFSIREGGTINWAGDPLGAKIDILADYKGERISLDNFIKEYTVNNETLAQSARKRTDVDLLLHLTGSLLHPAVSFDLSFPNLEGDIKSYVFSKLQKLKSDQNLMYTQAVTLLSLGAFLPQDNLSGIISSDSNVSTAATGLHTGLQYLLNVHISKYITGLFEELFSNSTWISGIDIDLNVINSQSILADASETNIWPNEYTYDAKLHLFEDKASLVLSGSYVNKGTYSDRSYANGDFVFKYFITEDRKLRVEVYSKREFNELKAQEGWLWKFGAGLNYKFEFGDIYDLKKDVLRDIENKKNR